MLSPPSHPESPKGQDLKFKLWWNRGTSPSCEASEPPPAPPAKVCSHPTTFLGEACQRSCTHNPRAGCHQAIKSFCLSDGMRFLSQQAGYDTWVLVQKCLPACTWVLAYAGTRRGGNDPGKALQTALIKLFLKYRKAGLGLSNLAPKTAPRIHFAGSSGIVNPEESCTLHPHLPFRCAAQPSRAGAGERGLGAPLPCWGCQYAAGPGVSASCPCHGPNSTAGAGAACFPHAAAKHWEGDAGLSDTI